MQNTEAQCVTNSVYALDQNGFLYPLNTSTGALQTPLNTLQGVASGSDLANGLGYSTATGNFYYFANTNTASPALISYNALLGYTTLSSPFTGIYKNDESVLATGTATGTGYYALDANGYLWYYNISAASWTLITKKIVDNSGNNITTQFVNNYGSGDLVEDGYGNLYILLSGAGATTYGLYQIYAPPTTAVTTITSYAVVPYTTPMPSAIVNGDWFTGAAFDATGNLFVSSQAQLWKIPLNTTGGTAVSPIALVGAFSNFKSAGRNANAGEIYDLAQCTYSLTPLPLAWLNFNAILNDGSVNLSWEVAKPDDVSGFYVEKSADGKNWNKLNFVPFTYDVLNYSFIDPNPQAGTNYYRVEEIDENEKSNYSYVKFINLAVSSNISIWPNPATDQLHIQYAGTAANATALIYDALGRNLASVSIVEGSNTINISPIPAGIYFVVIKDANKEILYKKIIRKDN